MRPEIAAVRFSSSDWVRLESSYDDLSRRIAKKDLKGDGDVKCAAYPPKIPGPKEAS